MPSGFLLYELEHDQHGRPAGATLIRPYVVSPARKQGIVPQAMHLGAEAIYALGHPHHYGAPQHYNISAFRKSGKWVHKDGGELVAKEQAVWQR